MMLPRPSSAGLVALSCALVFMLRSVIADTSDDSSSLGCVPRFFGDGDCDVENDTEDCGYDSGDCCECTCVSTADHTCGADGGYLCLDPSAPCVDDDDVTITIISTEGASCLDVFFSDGDCDEVNNNADCGYDGGDCCACTCVTTEAYTCGEDSNGGFACLDPRASCVDDDDYVFNSDDFEVFDEFSASFSYTWPPWCRGSLIGDGDCDADNNNEHCEYDGGDCCECDCVDTSEYPCGYYHDYNCVDPTSTCVNGYVEAGTKTTVSVSTNAYDMRPGEDSANIGCGDDGCTPALSRDGISDDDESRWSCAQRIVPDGGLCEIEFAFESPQDIVNMEVAFRFGDERSRTLEATIDGEFIGEFASYPGSTFNTYSIEGSNVQNLKLTANVTQDNGWISLLEVRFLVEP